MISSKWSISLTARRTFTLLCLLTILSLNRAGRVPSCVNIACEDDEPGTARCNQRRLKCIPKNHIDARFLDMHGNRLTSLIEDSFRHFIHLQKLDLSMNQIRSIIPGAFSGLTNLTNLILKLNKIFTLSRGTFNGANHLESLDLSRNNITLIEPGSFDGLQSLKTLLLHDNLIHNINDGTLYGLRTLNYLALQSNNIATIATRSFQGMTALHTLQLNDNRLETLPNLKFQLPSLKNLWISNNRLQCDCRLEFLRRWLGQDSGVSITIRHPILCAAPTVLQGRDMRLFRFEMQCVSPNIVKNPKTVMAIKGRSLVVPCNATGVPDPTVMWLKPEGSLVTSEANQRVTMTNDGSLRILQARVEDSGNYTCRALNAGGQDSSSVTVMILHESHVTQESWNSITSYDGYDPGHHLPELSYPDSVTTPTSGCGKPSATPICDATVGVITTAFVTFITTLATCMAFFYIWYKRQNTKSSSGYKEHIDDVDVSCDETPMRHKKECRRKSKIVSVINSISMPAYMYAKPTRPRKKPNRSFRMGTVDDHESSPSAVILPSLPSCHSVTSTSSQDCEKKEDIIDIDESIDTDVSYEEGDTTDSLDSNNLYENALILTADPNYSALDPMTRCIMNDTYEDTEIARSQAVLL